MIQQLKRLVTIWSISSLLMVLSINGRTQNQQPGDSAKRVKENFDFNWQFHKGDIAMKRVIKAGGQGGLTDVNVKVITKPRYNY